MKKISCLTTAILMAFSAFAGNFNDGLRRSSPEEQGVHSEDIASLVSAISEKGYEIHSLMIIRNNAVIAEHWWAPYAPEYSHAMYSNTKSWTSMAIGFAVQEGLLKIDDRLVDIFPDLVPADADPRTYKLTVFHLLSMSAGHAPASGGSTLERYAGAGDEQVCSFLSSKFGWEPGTHFEYNINCSHMLSNIISRLTGMTLYEYLKPRLLDPLGVEPEAWEMDLSGRNMGNGGMHLKTSDMAKYGLFILNKGKWNGQQLLNSEWIDAATTPHIFQKGGNAPEADAKDDGGQGYGYQIWMGRHNSFRAIGAQNQVTLMLPEQNLVVVSTGAIGDEAGFNSLVYEFSDKMSDKKVKKNNKDFDLEKELAKYSLKKPFETASAAKLTSQTKKYQMFQNDLGISAVAFRYDAEGNVYVTLESNNSINNLSFGLDKWLISASDRKMMFARSAYPNTMGVTPYRMAGMASWENETVLNTYYLSMFNTGSSESFRFTFTDNFLKMEILAPSSTRRGAVAAVDVVLEGALLR